MGALDGFRAVAAFSVVLAHGYGLTLFDGVTAFFVLSGFLITTLLLREQEARGAISLRAFYARRTLRIFPAYYACVAASFIIDHVAGNPWPAGLAGSSVVYGVNYYNAFNGHPSTSIAHLWSLGVEEQFYLLWPAVFIVLTRFGLPVLRRSLIILILAGVAWRCFLHFGGFVGQAYLYNAFDARFDNLAVGCLFAAIALSPSTARLVERISAYSWTPLVTLAAMAVVQHGMGATTRHLVGFTLYAVLVAVLIAQLLHLRESALWQWLDFAPVRFLGTISYPIYLYHAWGLGLGRWLTMMPPVGQFAAGVVFTIAGAVGSYYVVEQPFLRLKRYFAPERDTPLTALPVGRDLVPKQAAARWTRGAMDLPCTNIDPQHHRAALAPTQDT
ncbi:MAG: acyltransferase [Gammaproteobacteria bacterium]